MLKNLQSQGCRTSQFRVQKMTAKYKPYHPNPTNHNSTTDTDHSDAEMPLLSCSTQKSRSHFLSSILKVGNGTSDLGNAAKNDASHLGTVEFHLLCEACIFVKSEKGSFSARNDKNDFLETDHSQGGSMTTELIHDDERTGIFDRGFG